MSIELKGLNEQEVAKVVPGGTVLLGYRGSIAHGMYVPNTDPNSIDDKDIMGVCIKGLDVYFGLRGFEQQEVFLREWDSVVYEMRKFVRLLAKGNPNVLSLLWLEPRHYIHVEPEGAALIEARQMFVGRHVYHSFTGYAYGQLKRMTHFAFQGYMGDKRKQLVHKFGYDVKNAAHLIRLLRMGIEFLREGTLYVDRGVKGDAPNLLEIKRGEWPIDRVKAEAEHLFKRAEQAYDECRLPDGVDQEAVNRLLVNIISKSILERVLGG